MDFYLCLHSLQMTNTGKCWLTESFKDSSHNTQAAGAVWEGSATKKRWRSDDRLENVESFYYE